MKKSSENNECPIHTVNVYISQFNWFSSYYWQLCFNCRGYIMSNEMERLKCSVDKGLEGGRCVKFGSISNYFF